jgi:alpha-L-fucosidase
LAMGTAPPGRIAKVELLGYPGRLAFTQDTVGLKVRWPAQKPCDFAYVLKISGLSLLKSESQG